MLNFYEWTISRIQKKVNKTKLWFQNLQLANEYNVSEVVELYDTTIEEIKLLTSKNKKLTTEKTVIENSFVKLQDSFSAMEQKHKKELDEALDEHRNFIIGLCKEYNIRSPFDAPPSSAPIVQKEFFRFSKVKRAIFLEKLLALGIKPNEEQKAMLFCENPAACIQAGAGSGKSTMLAARVAFLNLENNIPFSNITVTTFTRESRREFIEKLVNNVQKLSNGRLPFPFGEKEAQKVVRTFHSLAYRVNKEFGNGERIILGDWTPVFETETGEEVDIEDLGSLSEKELQANYQRDTSVPKMSDLMLQAYEYLYTTNSKFKKCIDHLFRASIKQLCFNQKNPENNPYYNAPRHVEACLSEKLFNDWLSIDIEKHTNIATKYPPIDSSVHFKSNNRSTDLKYHLYLPKQELFIFVSPRIITYSGLRGFDKYCNSDWSLTSWIQFRKLFVYYKTCSSYIWVDSKEALEMLLEREKKFDDFPPEFAYACVGEYIKMPHNKGFVPIYEQFKSLSNFVYSLGKAISDFSSVENKSLLSHVPINDRFFLEASITFNKTLEKFLARENLITFEQIFHKYQDASLPALTSCHPLSISWCAHLLIDEFQDISPNIIKFINNLKAIYTSKTELGSLMFVGDGNQSIYVWRGSSYLYIKMPDEFFSVAGYFSILPLRDNYRSAKNVIELAKIPLFNIGAENSVIPARSDLDSMECILSIKRPNTANGETLDYDQLCIDLKREVVRVNATSENPVYVLFTRHSLAKDTKHKEWDSLFQSLTKSGQVKDLTIHTSKGLEARSVFILGDIAPNTWNPIKNAMYEWCEIGTTYEDAQYHEANCLCYVAITRAKNNVFWYIDKLKDNGLAKTYFEKWLPIVS